MKFTFTGNGQTQAEVAGKHKHEPGRQVHTHGGFLTECSLCGRFMLYVERNGKGFWRVR